MENRHWDNWDLDDFRKTLETAVKTIHRLRIERDRLRGALKKILREAKFEAVFDDKHTLDEIIEIASNAINKE